MLFLFQHLQESAFFVHRFIDVFKHPPQDLHSVNVALVDNFFMLCLIAGIVGRMYAFVRRVIQGDDDASIP